MASVATQSIFPPSPLLALTDLPRAFLEMGTLSFLTPLLAGAPHGDGHPVLVLPGFTASDASTLILRRYLAALGYEVNSWNLGPNLGPKAVGQNGEKLLERLREVYDLTGRRVSIVGWSLGGVMARMISRAAPDMVRQVISLGSPFAGSPRATNVWRLYELLTGQLIDDGNTQAQLREGASAPPVPSTAIWSREDGVVAWQNCVEVAGERTDNIEVHGSHCGLAVNAAVLYAIADRLALQENGWKPFERQGLKRLCYPSAGHA